MLDAIGGAQRHPAGTDGRRLAHGEPGSHQDQPDTACCLCARRQRRQRSQQSGGVGCGAGWGAQWPVLVVVGGVLAADRPTQGYLSARVTASTSAAPAVSACGQRQRRPQRAAPVRAQPAGAGGRGDRRCGRYEPLRQVCGRKLRVGAAPARAAEGAPAARRSGRRCRRRRLEPRRSRGGRPASREGDSDCGRLDFGVAKGLTRRCMAVLTRPEPQQACWGSARTPGPGAAAPQPFGAVFSRLPPVGTYVINCLLHQYG